MSRSESCPSCNWDARCCFNCVFYDRNAHHGCRENQADLVADKERPNFCGYFEANQKVGAGNDEASKAKNQLDALFGGSSKEEEKPSQKSSLEDQFKDFMSKK